MAKTFEWDYAVAGDLLLRSPEIASFCEEQAARMTAATGMEYTTETRMGSQRVHVVAGEGKEKGAQWKVCPKCGRAHPNCDCEGS